MYDYTVFCNTLKKTPEYFFLKQTGRFKNHFQHSSWLYVIGNVYRPQVAQVTSTYFIPNWLEKVTSSLISLLKSALEIIKDPVWMHWTGNLGTLFPGSIISLCYCKYIILNEKRLKHTMRTFNWIITCDFWTVSFALTITFTLQSHHFEEYQLIKYSWKPCYNETLNQRILNGTKFYSLLIFFPINIHLPN